MAAPAMAQTAEPETTLSAADKSDVKRIEAYLNRIGTVRSRYIQVASNGSYAEGLIHIQRPGKMRIEYDPPTPLLIVADDGTISYFDKELEQVSYYPVKDTPAGILLAEKVKLSGDIKVTAINRRRGVISVSLIKNEEEDEGRLSLVFSDQPLILKKWIITDAQGITTSFSLIGPSFGVSIKPELFELTELEKDRDRD